MADVSPHAANTSRALPFRSPAWLTPARIGLVASALGTGVILAGGSSPFVKDLRTWSDRGELASLVLPFTAVAVAAAWVGIRSSSSANAVGRTLAAGAAAGAIVLSLLLATLQLASGSMVELRSVAIGAIFGGCAGSALSAPLAILIRAIVRARETPSHDGLDRIVALAGAYVAVMAGIAVMVGHGLGGSAVLGPVKIVGLSGVAVALSTAVRLALRIRWLRGVEEGREPPFARAPIEPEASRDVEPLLLDPAATARSAIVRRSSIEGYRMIGPVDVPVALAPPEGARPVTSLVLAGLRALLLLVVVSGVVGALELACVGISMWG